LKVRIVTSRPVRGCRAVRRLPRTAPQGRELHEKRESSAHQAGDALVRQAYPKLARVMRHIPLEAARQRGTAKRGGDAGHVVLHRIPDLSPSRDRQ